YLELLRAYKDMDELIRNVFSPGSIFLYEGENVLIQEFGSSWDTYFSILEVISRGKFGPAPIANKLGMKVQMLPKYLKTLKDLELIRRRRPIFGKPRHVRYVVNDPFFRFWFKTCYPRIGLFMDGRARLNVEEVRSVVGKGMEKVIMDLFFDTGSFPFEPDQVGSWWDRSGNEVDLLFYNEKKKMMGVGEIKWRSRKVGSRTVEDLLYKIAMIDWYNEKRVEIPFIVSKSGFTETAIDRMEEHGVKGFSMEDLRTAVLKKKALDW
ncbi:MAG: DUF234 domain-containing protein, partial [Candidatus Thermoplasmatota archaeon]|nr:DUF234 domain-containing protein [Candidatus Thermoplasmatota archaeon]